MIANFPKWVCGSVIIILGKKEIVLLLKLPQIVP